MSYQSDLHTALTTDTDIAALVGDRVFADVADGSVTAPYLVYQVITTAGETTHDGERNLEFPTIQFSCWASTKAESIALASAVTSLVDGTTLPGTSELTLRFSNQLGDYESETKLFGETLEYLTSTNKN